MACPRLKHTAMCTCWFHNTLLALECKRRASHLVGQLEEGIVALACEIVLAARGWAHEGNATLGIQGCHPGVDRPAGQPAWTQGVCGQEDKFELL